MREFLIGMTVPVDCQWWCLVTQAAVAATLDLNGPALSPCGHWLLFNLCGKGERLYRIRFSHTPTMMLDKTTLATPTMMLDGSLDHCFDVDVANVLKLDTSVIVSFSELGADLNVIPVSGRGVQDT